MFLLVYKKKKDVTNILNNSSSNISNKLKTQ